MRSLIFALALASISFGCGKSTEQSRDNAKSQRFDSFQSIQTHLASKGLDLKYSTSITDSPDRPAVWFYRDFEARVLVAKCKSEQQAKEAAGTDPNGFAIGVFAFTPYDHTKEGKSLLSEIKKSIN